MSLVAMSLHTIDLTGLKQHTVRALPLIHAACVLQSHLGPVVAHWYQMAHMPDDKTVISALQLEAHGCKVHDKAKKITGEQPYVESPDGYKFPLNVRCGLPYLDARPVRNDEWDKLPHVIMTADTEWDPSIYDGETDPKWGDSQENSVDKHYESLPYDKNGVMDAEVATAVTEGETSDEELGEGAITVGEIEANFTELVADELVDSVIEFEVDGAVFHRYLDSDDEECEWGEWQNEERQSWTCYDVRGTRRSSRRRTPIDYSDTSRQRGKKTKSAGPGRKRKGKNPSATVTDATATERETPTQTDTVSDDDESEKETPRTDYNNKAKSTSQNDERVVGPYLGKPSKKRYGDYARHFGGVPDEVIRQTFNNTTQLGRLGAVKGLKLWKRLKSPNPALSVFRRNEPVATDTVYGPEPAVDDGSTAAQFFIGRKSGFVSVEPLGPSDKRFPRALMDHIRKHGAMDMLISDNAKALISDRVKEILGTFGINNWNSEAHNKNQNFGERGYRDVKRMVIHLLNYSGAPGFCWLLALQYACFVINHLASQRLGWRTPMEWLTGSTPDITPLLAFIFYQPVYYREFDREDDETEKLGRFVGIADSVGHALTFKILTAEHKIVARSLVRPATKTGVFENMKAIKRAPSVAPQLPNATIKSGTKTVEAVIPEAVKISSDPQEKVVPVTVTDDEDSGDDESVQDGQVNETCVPSDGNGESEPILRSAMEDILEKGGRLPELDSADILGRTFITTPDDAGEQRRAKIESAEPIDERTADDMQPLWRFKCRVGDKVFDEIVTYNRMLEWCDRDLDKDDFFRFVAIHDHRRNSKAKGGWQLLVEWASGQRTWNDLTTTFEGDPVTVSMYAKKHGLLKTVGWRRCKRYVRNAKTMGRAINQVRLKNYRNRPVYKYGHQVPRSHHEAMLIDEKNGNDKWAKSEELEKSQIMDYKTFEVLGKGAPIPEGYTKIPCHMVYDVKHDGRYKSRFVAGGHRTSTPVDSVYSGVVSLQGIRIVTFLAELNDLELWGTDIGNAYLESYTSEKVAFVAGPEFGPELEGQTCIIRKALYRLKSSGKCWHDRLADVLRDMGFFPSKAEEDIWMRDAGDHYEYVAVYVDDLLIASKNPQEIIDALTGDPNNFKLKGTGPIKFHLGCDFFRDQDGILCMGPQKYIERMVDQYKLLFGKAPSQKVQSPLEKNDHPELDDSALLDDDGIAKYQSLIGVLQWTITLGRFDIATAVMTMSGFRVAPREGHLERVRRICGYLAKFKHGCIRVRTDMPDYSDLPFKDYEWGKSVYGDVKEERPRDAPPPKGKPVVTTTYKDANLAHDLITGRAVTGVIHFLNQTPVEWFSKKQATVETATYGSEFAAAKVAIQQIAGLRHTLRYLGVNLGETSYLFGDNESVVTSGSIPHSNLSKRHQMLAFHYTREAVASKMVAFHHIFGDMNPADILSKHWGHSQIYPMLRPILFYHGDTIDLIED